MHHFGIHLVPWDNIKQYIGAKGNFKSDSFCFVIDGWTSITTAIQNISENLTLWMEIHGAQKLGRMSNPELWLLYKVLVYGWNKIIDCKAYVTLLILESNRIFWKYFHHLTFKVLHAFETFVALVMLVSYLQNISTTLKNIECRFLRR